MLCRYPETHHFLLRPRFADDSLQPGTLVIPLYIGDRKTRGLHDFEWRNLMKMQGNLGCIVSIDQDKTMTVLWTKNVSFE